MRRISNITVPEEGAVFRRSRDSLSCGLISFFGDKFVIDLTYLYIHKEWAYILMVECSIRIAMIRVRFSVGPPSFAKASDGRPS